jgi:hypothetical protein
MIITKNGINFQSKTGKRWFLTSFAAAAKILYRTVVSPLCLFGKIACWKLAERAVISNTLAANTLSMASAPGTITLGCI